MTYLFRNVNLYRDGSFCRENVSLKEGRLFFGVEEDASAVVIDCENYTMLPGLVDVHVHLREPGFSHKETIRTGSLAAAHGGYSLVCAMPNLKPTPDDAATLRAQLEIIERDAVIRVIPYGTITRGEKGEELSDLAAMAPDTAGFSDDGKGVQSPEMMKAAMEQAKALGKLIVAHCEDNTLLRGGYIHDGEYAAAHGHKGICSESEWGPIARDMKLAGETGCGYHVCHVSAKESVEVIRQAKKAGVNVTCETGPHYLLMNDSMLQEEGRFKMNPPIRSEEDRKALVEGILDGTIDMIITDHAPHSAEEKGKGLAGSLMGVVGIETCFPVMYTYFVKNGVLTMAQLMKLMHDTPCERFGLQVPFANGEEANFTLFDLGAEYTIDPKDFLSMGKSTPFEGWKVNGRCMLTAAKGAIAWSDETLGI